ncbi:MAG: hypothetical protein Q7R50_06390 [Dehalococcoidales bacterium]|nr:hypothetical protein [Dehalococcoidales bacterium]
MTVTFRKFILGLKCAKAAVSRKRENDARDIAVSQVFIIDFAVMGVGCSRNRNWLMNYKQF